MSYWLYEEQSDRKRAIATDAVPATVVIQNVDGKRSLRIDMQPFVIPISRLKLNVKQDMTSWHHTLFARYRVKLCFMCHNSNDAAALLSLVESECDGLRAPAESCELRSNRTELPTCPPEGALLPLYRGPRHECSEKLKYRLDLQMSWDIQSQSPLTIYNKAFFSFNSRIQDQVGTRAIVYAFTGTNGQSRATRVMTNECLFCPSRKADATFDELHFHYLTMHDHFVYAVTHDGETIRVDIETIDRSGQRPTSSNGDGFEMNWVQPPITFDLPAYLRGDNVWLTGKPAVPRRARSVDPERTIRKASTAATTAPKDASEVLPILPRQRKRFVVPNVPGVTFFRNVSKRRVEPGELLSESDDNLDTEWLETRQRLRKIDNLDVDTESFVRLFDKHIAEEHPSGDRYLADTLVRFCLRYAQTLEQPIMQKGLALKLQQLLTCGLIHKTTFDYCSRYTAPQMSKPIVDDLNDTEMQDEQ